MTKNEVLLQYAKECTTDFHDQCNHRRQCYRDWLVQVALHYNPKIIVEIGINAADTTNLLQVASRNFQGVVYGVDCNKRFAGEPEFIFIHGDSHAVGTAEQVPDGIELLFIDGDHTYDSIQRDWELYVPKVVKGGIVVIDDCNSECEPDVGRWLHDMQIPVTYGNALHQEQGTEKPGLCWWVKE